MGKREGKVLCIIFKVLKYKLDLEKQEDDRLRRMRRLRLSLSFPRFLALTCFHPIRNNLIHPFRTFQNNLCI